MTVVFFKKKTVFWISPTGQTHVFLGYVVHLGNLESTQEARAAQGVTLTLLSCSPNFPRS